MELGSVCSGGFESNSWLLRSLIGSRYRAHNAVTQLVVVIVQTTQRARIRCGNTTSYLIDVSSVSGSPIRRGPRPATAAHMKKYHILALSIEGMALMRYLVKASSRAATEYDGMLLPRNETCISGSAQDGKEFSCSGAVLAQHRAHAPEKQTRDIRQVNVDPIII